MEQQSQSHPETEKKLNTMIEEAQEFIIEGSKLLDRYSITRARKIRKLAEQFSKQKIELRKIMIAEEKK